MSVVTKAPVPKAFTPTVLPLNAAEPPIAAKDRQARVDCGNRVVLNGHGLVRHEYEDAVARHAPSEIPSEMLLSWIESAIDSADQNAVVIALNSHAELVMVLPKMLVPYEESVAIAFGVPDTVLLAIVPFPPELKMAIELLGLPCTLVTVLFSKSNAPLALSLPSAYSMPRKKMFFTVTFFTVMPVVWVDQCIEVGDNAGLRVHVDPPNAARLRGPGCRRRRLSSEPSHCWHR